MMRVCEMVRRMVPRSLPVILAALVSFAWVGNVRGEASFSLDPAAAGTYIITGTGLEKIAALDFTVVYDITTARNPTVMKGEFVPADASFFANTAIPGELRIMVIRNREIAGSGILATISFEKAGSMAPRVLSFTSHPISVTASPLDASARATAPPATEQAEPQVRQPEKAEAEVTPVRTPERTVQAVPAPVQGATALGSVVMPDDRSEPEKEPIARKEGQAVPSGSTEQPLRPVPPAPEIRPAPAPSPSAPPSPPPAPPQKVVYRSVLDRMKEYKGERSPAALTALFTPAPDQKIRQEPAVAVSDGERSVTLRAVLPLTLKETPSFSLRSANMVSLDQAEDGSWIIVIVPRKNTLDARITISFDGSTMVYPLVVAPPVDPALLTQNGSPEAAFSAFLKQAATGREPRFDLNGDGKFDVVDDYIFTAQYLAAGPARKNPGEKLP